jgi:hypothetical protein
VSWTRNLFDGAERAPLLDADQRIVVWDSAEPSSSALTPSGAVWLKSVGLHMTTPYRAFAVLGSGARLEQYELPGGYVYEPFTAPVLAQPQSDRETR